MTARSAAPNRVPRQVPLSALIVLLVISVAFAIVLTLFFRNRYVASLMSERLAETASDKSAFEDLDELRKTIASYETEIERHIGMTVRTGLYWKLLATRLMDRGLYDQAVPVLEKAIGYFPDDPALQYSTGLAAAFAAKGSQDFELSGDNRHQDSYFALAEAAQLRAIAMDPKYARALYALGVLYVFELDRSAEAIPYLRRYLELRKDDFDGYFLLARAYYLTGALDEAVALYDGIIASSRDPDKRAEAAANKLTVLETKP